MEKLLKIHTSIINGEESGELTKTTSNVLLDLAKNEDIISTDSVDLYSLTEQNSETKGFITNDYFVELKVNKGIKEIVLTRNTYCFIWNRF